MAAPRALSRLLRVLELEEEQAHSALKAALAELGRLEEARRRAAERERAGRRLLAASALSGEIVDRLAGFEEMRAARGLAAVARARIGAANREVAARREVFLGKRVERRQAETLIEQAAAREAADSARRSQQAVDESYLDQKRRNRRAASADGGGEPRPMEEKT